jgi:hypothetical protein
MNRRLNRPPHAVLSSTASIVVASICLLVAGCDSGGSAAPVKPISSAKKWAGTWNEPYAIVGTRSIIVLTESSGGLTGTISDPAIPNGTDYNMRIPFALTEITEVDENTLTCKESGLVLTLKYIPGENGDGPTMQTSKDPAGTIGGMLGQTKPHVATFKKE